MAAIVVGVIAPKRRDLNAVHEYHAELCAYELGSREKLDHLTRHRVRGDIVVRGLASQHQVADAPSHKPRLITAMMECCRNPQSTFPQCGGTRHHSDRRINVRGTSRLNGLGNN